MVDFGEDGPPRAERPRVLLVDDEVQVLDALMPSFRRKFDVVTRTRPAAALELLAREPEGFVAVVSDLRMPEMDGIAFLTEVKKRAPSTCRLLLSGYTDLAAALSAVNDASVHRLLTKPCPAAQVARIVEEVVEDEAAKHDPMELDERTIRLERKAVIGEMTGALGQELGNLVTALSSSLELVQHDVERGEVSPEDIALIGVVKNRLIEHTKALKELSKPRAEGRSTLDVSSFVCHTIDMLKKTGLLRIARSTIDLPLERVSVDADALQLEGVLLNLLKNAAESLQAKADYAAETNRFADHEPLRIRVAVETHGDVVSISVDDNGLGVPLTVRDRIFDPYFTTKIDAGSTGLGLAIARETVERHGGRLFLESSGTGTGARFVVALPRTGTPPLLKGGAPALRVLRRP